MKSTRSRVPGGLIAALALCVVSATALAGEPGAEPAGMVMTHRMVMLVIQVGLILFAARIGNILFEKAKLPGALGELAAGIIIGPFALGQFAFYGFPEGLFPTAANGGFAISPELYGLSTIAAVVLLFNVGLETNLKLLLRYSVIGGVVGLGGLVASFFLGAGSVMVFSEAIFGKSLGLFAPQCLFLGTITTATSVGITARILSEKRKLDSPEGVTILSAAVIDDVLGIILLAVVMSVISASRATGRVDWGQIAGVGVKAVGVWLGATIIGLIASRKISVLLKWFRDRTAIAIMALGLALILAGLFEEAGLAMIIGAYVMGLSLSKADITHVIREKLKPVYALLIPIFFCTTGMQINLGLLASPPVLIFGLVYALVALGAKVIGCGIPAMFANFNLRGAARIGFGMAPRCEVALIIAGVGLSAGVLGAEILAAVIIMVAINTVVAPPAMTFLFRSDARGTRRPVAGDKPETTVSFACPSIEMAAFFVGKLVSVFEAEGFFVHEVSHSQHLHQLRKDSTVIDFKRSGAELTFYCRQSEARLVNAAMYEALAELERAVRGLKKPIDTKSIRTGLLDAGPLGPPGLNMAAYLTPKLVEPKLRGTTKAQIIDELLEILVRNKLLGDVDAARRAVWEREESMSTGLQYGVAIPHGKTDAVSRLVCAVGVKRDGMDFAAMDDEPSRIFILTLSPKHKPAPHVQFMSNVSQILNPAGRERILACRSARQICEAFLHPVVELPPAAEETAPETPSEHMASKFILADYVRPQLVRPDLQAGDGEGIIRELVGVLAAGGVLADPDKAVATVLAREAQMSTGMEEGLAVPHGRTDAVDRLVCAVGVKRAGVDFGAADGKPTRIFMLVLTPEQGADPYLQFVASAMTVLDAEGRRRVLAASTHDELVAALTQEAKG